MLSDIRFLSHVLHFAPKASVLRFYAFLWTWFKFAKYVSPSEIRNTASFASPLDFFAYSSCMHICIQQFCVCEPRHRLPSFFGFVSGLTSCPMRAAPTRCFVTCMTGKVFIGYARNRMECNENARTTRAAHNFPVVLLVCLTSWTGVNVLGVCRKSNMKSPVAWSAFTWLILAPRCSTITRLSSNLVARFARFEQKHRNFRQFRDVNFRSEVAWSVACVQMALFCQQIRRIHSVARFADSPSKETVKSVRHKRAKAITAGWNPPRRKRGPRLKWFNVCTGDLVHLYRSSPGYALLYSKLRPSRVIETLSCTYLSRLGEERSFCCQYASLAVLQVPKLTSMNRLLYCSTESIIRIARLLNLRPFPHCCRCRHKLLLIAE